MTKKPNHDEPSLTIDGPGPSTEILELVTRSLAAEPERADLWMMRFEVQKTLGLKRQFADALVRGWRHPRVARQLDWGLVRSMWNELAPGEPVPEGITLPTATASSSPLAAPSATPGLPVTPPDRRRDRRFADMANRLARRELGALARAYAALQARPGFAEEFARRIAPMLRRPTPLQLAEQLTRLSGNVHVRIFLKREDLRSVSPEMENAAAQCCIAAMLGRLTVIGANDVDAHALALAEVAPTFSLKCVIVVRPGDLVGKPDLIDRLRGFGARIEATTEGIGTDPRPAAVRLWQKSMGHAHLALSLGTGPSPYPAMVANFQSVLGRETELQMRAVADGRSRTMVAAVDSEADSIGFMLPQLARKDIELTYAEPAPGGIASWRPSTRLGAYNGGIREHAWLRGLGRTEYVAVPDAQATAARGHVERVESLKVSLEDARAVALALRLAPRDREPRDYVVLVA
ncbi:MAG TPA: pyridoxal-phosphate dependent enzyme [Verrucomicrobiae bacterium]|nr:pyridoxal-phosphate dependent enzyme [Verrucomicrobiae bacterium]